MKTAPAGRRRLLRTGIGMLFLGSALGVTGLVATPAGAEGGITICHATASNAHPYIVNTPNTSGVDGSANHFDHTGPVWNSTLKALKITWGDIIPPVVGSHEGLNWTEEGQAIWNNGCKIPGEAPACEYDPLLYADDEDCVPPECDAGQTGTYPNCVDPACAQGQTGTFPNCVDPVVVVTDACLTRPGVQASTSECPTVVLGNVIRSTTPAPAQVGGASLPRTGSDTLPLVWLSLGLILTGAGALVLGRERTATV